MNFDDILPLIFIAIFVANALRRRGGRPSAPPRPSTSRPQVPPTPGRAASDAVPDTPDTGAPAFEGFDLERALAEARRRVSEANASREEVSPASPTPPSQGPGPSFQPPGPPSMAPVAPSAMQQPHRPAAPPIPAGFLGREGVHGSSVTPRLRTNASGSLAKKPLGDVAEVGSVTAVRRAGSGRWTWDADAAVRGTVWNVALAAPASIGWARRWGGSRRR